MRSLRIGTRASALARWQAESVRTRLADEGIASELVLVRTTGDRDRDTPLRVLGGKGIFTKELEDALLAGSVDLAVHSMKDVPTELPAGLVISAICKRDDVRDALIVREAVELRSGSGSAPPSTFERLPSGARVGTSSLRRQAQLLYRRPDLTMAEIRGNVDTRLSKLVRGDFDAIVLAKAGLDRLGMSERITEILPAEICLPAAGQGAIGMESRADDGEVIAAIGQINHAETYMAVHAERIVLGGLQGGCQVPIGVWARMEADEFVIDACVLTPNGSDSLRVRRAAPAHLREDLARELTSALLDLGAGRLLRGEAVRAADRNESASYRAK